MTASPDHATDEQLKLVVRAMELLDPLNPFGDVLEHADVCEKCAARLLAFAKARRGT